MKNVDFRDQKGAEEIDSSTEEFHAFASVPCLFLCCFPAEAVTSPFFSVIAFAVANADGVS